MDTKNENILPEFQLAKPDIPVEMITNHWLRIWEKIAERPSSPGERPTVLPYIGSIKKD